jgi:hypothetical protein
LEKVELQLYNFRRVTVKAVALTMTVKIPEIKNAGLVVRRATHVALDNNTPH